MFSYCVCIFDELNLYNPKSREDRIDCCNNLGCYVLVQVSFKWIWPTVVELRVLKVGPRPQNTIFGSVLWTILAVSKKLKFNKFFPNHSSSGLICTGYFTDTKISKSWWEMVQEKQNYEKSFFCILIREQ